MKSAFYTLLLIAFFSFSGSAQVTTTVNSDAQQLVEGIIGKGFIISNPKLNCPDAAIGTFTSISSNIGLGKGIILTTGNVANISGESSITASVLNQAPGDPLLGTSTNDACRLEFDLVPSCDFLKFKYVFASEEYPEYVGSINDAFAFFISGPGFPTPLNIATLPNSSTPVNINNVNNVTNSAYYVDNTNGQTVVYDGFTIPLEATVKVTPCQSYHLVIVIADANDEMLDSGVFIEGNSLECPSPEIISPDVCANQASVELCAPAGFINYAWPPGQPGAVPPFDQQCITVNNPKAGDVYTVTMESATGGCPVSSKLVLKGSDFVIRDTTVCKNSPKLPLAIQPLTPGNYTYHWEPATNLSCSDCQNPVFDPISTQTYTITMTDTNVANCNRVREVTITVDTGFVLQVNSPEICEGSSVLLKVTGGNTYNWQPGGQSGDSIWVQPATTTTYTVNATSDNGCISETTATVRVVSKPTIQVSDERICLKEKVLLKATGATTYQWITGAVADTGSTLLVNPLITTIYTVIGSIGQCKDTTQATVTVNPLPVITVNAPKICSGETATLSATGATSYSWLGANGTILSTDSTLIAKVITTTTYTVIGTDTNGCKNSIVTTVSVSPLPDVITSGGVICLGDEFKLEAKGNAITYVWTASDSSKLPDQALVIVVPATNTTYTVTGSIAYCKDTAIAQVNVNLPPVITVNEGSICKGEKIQLTASGATKYSWSTGASTNTITVNPLTTTTYTITGIKDNCFQTIQTTVTVNENPDALFSMDPKELSEFAPTLHLINESVGNHLLNQWSFGDGSPASNQKDPVYTYAEPGSYTVCLKIADSLTHCKDSTCNNLIYKPEWCIYVPNAFSPNGNDLNEVFFAKGTNLIEFHMTIFDRWGAIVFESDDIHTGWDGKIKNERAKQDTYVWKINCKDISKKTHQYIGHVTLMN